MERGEAKRVMGIALIGFFISMWLIANSRDNSAGLAGWWYAFLIGFSLLFAFNFSKFSHGKLIGADKDWMADAMFGAFLGGAFVFLNTLNRSVFTLGLPASLTVDPGFLVVVLAAPIGEELGFRLVLLNWLRQWGAWAAIIISALAFTVFHQQAYGLASSAFVGAFIFGVLAAIVTLQRKSIVSALVMHGIFNAWLYTGLKIIS